MARVDLSLYSPGSGGGGGGATSYVTEAASTGVKLSQIAAGGSPPATTDRLVGVTAGNVDTLWTLAQIISTLSSSITVNATAIVGGSSGQVAYDNAGTFGEASQFSILVSGEPSVPNLKAYQYDGGSASVFRGNTLLGNFYLANSGNITMTGANNLSVGNGALINNTTGHDIVAIGGSALGNNTTGHDNTAIGSGALGNNQTSNSNIAIGSLALQLGLTAGDSNTAIGAQAMRNLTSGSGTDNIAIGGTAMNGATGGGSNVAIGANTNNGCTSGQRNIAVGPFSLVNNQTGNDNVGLGLSALQAGTSASQNVAIGANALSRITTQNDSVVIGHNGFSPNQTGVQNVGVGSMVGGAQTGGIGNNTECTMVGYASGGNSFGTLNSFFGWQSGNAVTGSNNVIIGPIVTNTFNSVTSGNNNVTIGYDVTPNSPTASNQLTISNYIYGTGMNGTGTTISAGKIGLGIKAPAVELDVNGSIKTASSLVAGLPAAGNVGARRFVTDANSTTFASIVAGLGTNGVPVYDDGTNWRIG